MRTVWRPSSPSCSCRQGTAFHCPFTAFHRPFTAFHCPFTAFHRPFTAFLRPFTCLSPSFHSSFSVHGGGTDRPVPGSPLPPGAERDGRQTVSIDLVAKRAAFSCTQSVHTAQGKCLRYSARIHTQREHTRNAQSGTIPGSRSFRPRRSRSRRARSAWRLRSAAGHLVGTHDRFRGRSSLFAGTKTAAHSQVEECPNGSIDHATRGLHSRVHSTVRDAKVIGDSRRGRQALAPARVDSWATAAADLASFPNSCSMYRRPFCML